MWSSAWWVMVLVVIAMLLVGVVYIVMAPDLEASREARRQYDLQRDGGSSGAPKDGGPG